MDRDIFYIRRRIVAVFLLTEVVAFAFAAVVMNHLAGYSGDELTAAIQRALVGFVIGILTGTILVFVAASPLQRAGKSLAAGMTISEKLLKRATWLTRHMQSIFLAFNLFAYGGILIVISTLGAVERGHFLMPQPVIMGLGVVGAFAFTVAQILLINLRLQSVRTLLQTVRSDERIFRRGSFRRRTFWHGFVIMFFLASLLFAMIWHLIHWETLDTGGRDPHFFVIYASVIVFLTLMLLAFLYAQELASHFKRLSNHVRRIDLSILRTNQLAILRQDELGRLTASLNGLIGRLSSLFTSIRDNTFRLLRQSDELSPALIAARERIESLSERMNVHQSEANESGKLMSQTVSALEQSLNGMAEVLSTIESQANMVNETAAAAEQLRASIDSVAETSERASDLAEWLKQTTNDGIATITNTIDSIRAVSDAGRDVEEIVHTISTIANRINLLATNAAIEAAHGGKSSKGFSVVANEIRTLSLSTSKSTQDITLVLNRMRARIEEARRLSDELSDLIRQVGVDVDNTTQRIFAINSATRRQSRAVNETGRWMQRLVQVTAEVRDQSEQQQQHTQQLSDQMSKLEKVIADLRILTDRQMTDHVRMLELMEEVSYIFGEQTQSLRLLGMHIGGRNGQTVHPGQ